mgnify:CR=1 FL=1
MIKRFAFLAISIRAANLFRRGPFHEVDDRRQAGVFANLIDTHDDRTLRIDRPPCHRRTKAFRDRSTLAGEQRLVGATDPFDHRPVGGNRLPGFDQHKISHLETGHGHLGWTLSAVTADMVADVVLGALRPGFIPASATPALVLPG